AGAPERFDQCPECRAIVCLNDVDALLAATDVDAVKVREAIERFETVPEQELEFIHHFNLGLAYLNAKRFRDGVARMEEACRLQPENEVLRAQVDVLASRA